MRKLILPVLLIISINLSSAYSWQPSHYVIIDTDGGIDDLRTISMLLASPDIRVLAITTSGGFLSPEQCYTQVMSLLNSYHHSGIPVGINRGIDGNDTDLTGTIKWGIEEGVDPVTADEALDVIKNVLTFEKTMVSFISLGNPDLIHEILNEAPVLRSKILRLIQSNDQMEPVEAFNNDLSGLQTSDVLSDKIPLININSFEEEIIYTDDFINKLENIHTRYADKIVERFNSNDETFFRDFERRAISEMIVVYLFHPGIFNHEENDVYKISEGVDENEIRSLIQNILSGHTADMNQWIKRLPADSSFYPEDLQTHIIEIIEMHGQEEWSSGILVNELNDHLGIFDIIGVKMGILAREYFHIGVDEMNILSYAGSFPPLSCINDGLLVATGATPGYGLLTVINDMNNTPEVEFTYRRNSVKISLLPEVYIEISSELREINYAHGQDSDIYWDLVRQKAILHWKNLSRYEIFKIEEVN